MLATVSVCVILAATFTGICGEDIFHDSLHIQPHRGFTMGGGMAVGKLTPLKEMDTRYWIDQAQNDLRERLGKLDIYNKAKNIILFLGDGMSVPTTTAARIRKGQLAGGTGEESTLSWDKFPYAGLSKTYCTNGQTPDSSCTATAYLCGVKTNLLTTGVNAHVNYNNCSASANVANHVDSIAVWAQQAGKSTAIVTTTTVTHASPSAAYAHVANRLWECDADIVKYGADPTEGCVDIARQLIKSPPGSNFDVILGGGMGKFLPTTKKDEFGEKGQRRDGVNLITQWKLANPKGKFVSTRDQLLKLNYEKTSRIFGTFASGDLEFHLDADKKRPTQPTLKEMTESAIRILQKNPNGFFAFIEGGRIDHGHHYTKAGYALDEALEFDAAVAAAVAMTSEEDTLIVVTADHAHTMSIAGYPGRGNPILGLNQYDVDIDGTPYSTLNYAVGIEQYLDEHGKRLNLTGKLDDLSFTPSYIKATMGTHAGDDVGVYAQGPHAKLFSGVMQQNLIPHMMAYAACIGNGTTLCSNP